MDKHKHGRSASCDEYAEYKTGQLPGEAPLAVSYVPFQRENPPQYSYEEAINRGTIFPGLDLPWKNTVNRSNPAAGTPLGDVMALEFAADELQLYLDTHPHDQQAAEMFCYYVALAKQAKERYEALYGPLCRENAVQNGEYAWLSDPWPWEYQDLRERKN